MLSMNLCGKLIYILLQKPHLVPGTVAATIEATLEADKRYAQSHLADNIANGYKHAAWNVLIAYYAQYFYKSPEDATHWAKKITDMHEACFPNEAADRQMDLDNNLIGRELYLRLFKENQKRPHKKTLLNQIEKQDLKTLT
ncbi:hypothetical protein GO491_07990 [Flavobacteriaceae bacterium Ap0902]|nr:hypothetical protein [Flavobacteriaceae bacterium Ap0902]